MPGPWEKYGGAPQAPAQPGGDMIVKPAPTPAPPSPTELARVDIARQNADLARQKFEYEQQQDAAKPAANAADPKVQAKLANLDALTGQINRVQELYDTNLRDEALGVLSSLADYLPTPTNRQFDSAAAGMAEQGLAAFRVPGVGAQSDTELRQFVEANKPSASDADLSIEEKLRQLRARVDATRAAMGLPPAEWRGAAQTREDAPPAPGEGAPPPGADGNPEVLPFTPGGDQMQVADGTRTVADPKMAAVGEQYRQMLSENRPASEIIQFLKSSGAGTQTLMQAMQQIKYRRENPNVPIDRYRIDTTQEVPLSRFEQTITDIGSGGAGAYALGAANFLSGNNLDSLSGDPERARLALQVSQAQNPNAFGIGEVSGGVLAGLTGEAGLARLGMGNVLARGVTADAAMGGFNGAGMADNGGRVQNALAGAVTGALGSLGGTMAVRGASRAIAPSGGPLEGLYASGVRPTPGQRFSDSGAAGRLLNSTEEKLQSIPVVGDAIRGARDEARDQFQVGAFNKALAEVGEELPKGMKPGTAPHAYSQKVFDKVYDEARAGMRVVGDEELANDIGRLIERVGELSEPSQQRFRAMLKNTVMRRMKGDALEGDAYKAAYSELGKRIRQIRGSPSGDGELADALQDLQGALDSAARRHSDPAAVELLDAADRGYSMLVRIEEAARRRGGEQGQFSPLQFDAAVQREGGGIRSKAFLRGDALMQDYADEGRRLGDYTPNSGTFDRAAMGVAAGGGAAMDPTGVAIPALGLTAIAYAPGVRKLTKGAMAPSGPTAKRIAERLRKRARLIGSATAATGVAALPGTAPNP